MSSNSWLAIDVGTAPTLRAQELRFAWERFVAGLGHPSDDDDPDDVREPIVDSWRRSVDAGVDPTATSSRRSSPTRRRPQQRWEEHPLARAAPLIRECLAAIADEAEHLVVVTDADGVLLERSRAARALRRRAADDMNFAEGTLWSEPGAGTNAIGTALAADHAVQVFGPEHFNEVVQRWTCSAAPIHDPDTGELIGVIDLTGDFSTVHPHSLAVATATARAVEASLRLEHAGARRAPARALRRPRRRGARLARARDRRPAGRSPRSRRAGASPGRLAIPPGGGALTLPSGALAIAEPVGPAARGVRRARARAAAPARPRAPAASARRCSAATARCSRSTAAATELRPRLAEILALLCAHPDGLSAEALCADLHGDGGSPSSVRVEVSRLRKLLGPWIDTERYRLTCDVETDVAARRGPARAPGAVREAAEAYAGPLLPGLRGAGRSSTRASSSTPGCARRS